MVNSILNLHRLLCCAQFFAAGKLARSVWAQATSHQEAEAILAVQTARNAISAATWIAGVAAVLATAGLTIILDQGKTDRIAQLAVRGWCVRSADGCCVMRATCY